MKELIPSIVLKTCNTLLKPLPTALSKNKAFFQNDVIYYFNYAHEYLKRMQHLLLLYHYLYVFNCLLVHTYIHMF